MTYCISITDPLALKRWQEIPKTKRSKWIEEQLLKQGNEDVEELKALIIQLIELLSSVELRGYCNG